MTLRKMLPVVVMAEEDGVTPNKYTYKVGNGRGIEPMDGIQITWGRDELLDDPAAAVAHFTLKDPTKYLMHRLRDNQILGKVVWIYADLNGTFTSTNWKMFLGRISECVIEPGPEDKSTGEPAHYLVHLTASDTTAEMGNINVPKSTTWPAETMLDRAVRLNNLHQSQTLVTNTFFNPDHVGYQTYAYPAGGKSALELLRTFYWSEGVTYSYIPSENNIRPAYNPRVYNEGPITVRLTELGDVGDPKDNVFAPVPDDVNHYDFSIDTTFHYRGLHISGHESAADHSVMFVAPQAGANKVEVSFREHPSTSDTSAVMWVPALAAEHGVRTISVTSMLGHWTDIAATDGPAEIVLDQATREGARPQHPRLTVRISQDGFDSYRNAINYLDAGQKPFITFLSGSPWTAALESAAPLFQVLGGTVTYARGHWEIEWNLHTFVDNAVDTPTMVTWAGYNSTDNLRWGNNSTTNRVMESSVTWGDMRFVNYGGINPFAGGV